jgi:hypothetical protein
MKHRIEILFVTAFFCSLSGLLAFLAGGFGLSWDALNHHIYLGYIAESPRWKLDVAAASSQSYQHPYTYWFFYRLTLLGLTGQQAAVVWACFQTACVVPPLWQMSLHLMGSNLKPWEARALRFVSCTLGYVSIPVLAAISGSANDLLAATPLLWAFALTLKQPVTLNRTLLCGVLVGAAVALKFSNVVFLPLIVLMLSEFSLRRGSMVRLGQIGAAAAMGFLVAYAPWGMQLWREFGHPLFPHQQAVRQG